MKKSNEIKSESQRKRSEKNRVRIAEKTHLSKHEKWEERERLRIIYDALSK